MVPDILLETKRKKIQICNGGTYGVTEQLETAFLSSQDSGHDGTTVKTDPKSQFGCVGT